MEGTREREQEGRKELHAVAAGRERERGKEAAQRQWDSVGD